MPRKIDPSTLSVKHGTLPSGTVDDNAFRYSERDVDPLRVHLHDPSRAHMASAIGIVDAADCYLADEVEGALQELCGGMSAGRMNGMVEGGYIVSPPDGSGNPPYPTPAAAGGLEVTLVAPATGNPSTVLIGAHVVDISGATYDFVTGVDPVGGASTNNAGTYFLYVETDHTSADYQSLVASTTLPTVASEKILIAQIIHDGADINFVRDTRYFVANLDRKLPYTLRSGIPLNTGDGTFGGENTNTWSEALFQTLDAALFWTMFYGGTGDTQEEKATIIVRGRQVLSNANYVIRDGITLQGSGPDAQIVWQGLGTLFTITGSDVRFKDLQIILDNDVPVNTKAIDVTASSGGFTMDNCHIIKTAASLHWMHAMTANNADYCSFKKCTFWGGRTGQPIVQWTQGSDTNFQDCVFMGDDEATTGLLFDGLQVIGVTVKDCNFTKGNPAGSTAISAAGSTSSHSAVFEGNSISEFSTGIKSEVAHSSIINNSIEASVTAGADRVVGIWYTNDNAAEIGDAAIIGNWVFTQQQTTSFPVDSEPSGILIEGHTSASVTNNTIKGNWYNNNAGNTAGIDFGGGLVTGISGGRFPTPLSVSGNNIENGVIIERATGLTFTGNTVVTPLGVGTPANFNENLRIGSGSKDVTITGNVFDGGSLSANSGVRVFGSVNPPLETTAVQVTGNVCHDHSGEGLGGGIVFIGQVNDCVINGNTLYTSPSNSEPKAEGIRIIGVADLGTPYDIVVSGNDIKRFTRGIVAAGFVANDTPNKITNINVTNNTISEIGEAQIANPWNQQSYSTVNQGIVFAYGEHCNVTDNNLVTIGVTFDLSGAPILTADADYYGVGIHVWRSTRITVNDNTIHGLFSHKGSAGSEQPFCVGIYFCLTPHLLNSVPTEFDQYNCIGNTIYSPQATPIGVNRDNTIAGILVYANQDDEPTAFFTLDNFIISGNNIQDASHWVDPTEVPSFLQVGSAQTIGGCGILCWLETSSPTAAWPSTAYQVSITNNVINKYGQKAIAVRVAGLNNSTPESHILAKGFIVSGNQAEGASELAVMSYVDEESINMDGGIVILQGQSSSMWDLTVDSNTLISSLQTGIMVGTTGGNLSGDSSVYNASISNNKVMGLRVDKALTYDTYCVCVRALGPNDNIHKCLFKGIAVNGNKLGQDGNIVDNTISERWGVWFGVSTSAGAPGNRRSTALERVQIHDNNLYTAMAEIAIDQVGEANAALMTLEDISIQGNQGFRTQEDFGTSNHAAMANLHLGFHTLHTKARNIEVSNNSFVSSATAWPAGGFTYGLIGFRWTQSNPTLTGGFVEGVRILGNRFDGALGDPATLGPYVYAAMQLVFSELEHSDGFTIANNELHGGFQLVAQSTGLVFCRKWTIDNNRWSGKSRFSILGVVEAGAALNHNDGSGMRDWVLTNNQFEAYNDAGTPNDYFQVNLGGERTNVQNVLVSGNVFDLAETSGGLILAAEGSFVDEIAVTSNILSGGGRPHIYYKGQNESTGTNIRIEENTCEWLSFEDGGWGASAGHPDSVILYEGASVNNDTEGDEMISISRNIIRNCTSTNPDITDVGQNGIDKLKEANPAIYFGPSPDIVFNNGVGPTNAWQSVRNIFIDENNIQSCSIGCGIALNAFPVRYDVSNVSISRNRIGAPTKNVTEGISGWWTPIVGIEFLGKYMYQADYGVYEAGKKGMDSIGVDDNQVSLWNNATENDRQGIYVSWESEWDNSSAPVTTEYNTFAYNASNMSVSGNKVHITLTVAPGYIAGIQVVATSDVTNMQVDGNAVAVPKQNSSSSWTMDKGIWLRHNFQGSSSAGSEVGMRCSYFGGGVQDTIYNPEGGVWLTGAPCTLNPELKGVYTYSGTPEFESVKLVKWDNVSLSNNAVLGDCKYELLTALGNPLNGGAIVLQLVAYSGTASFSNRKMTMIPVYNLLFKGNSCKNDRLYVPETVGLFSHVGFNFLYTGLVRAVVTPEEGVSGLYRGWRIIGNSANWYCLSDASMSQNITNANTKGYDVRIQNGGYLGTVYGHAQENYCAQKDGTTGAVGVKGNGWDEIMSFDENANEIPWLV